MTNENTQTLVLGDVEITRVIEARGPFAAAPDLVPDAGAELWKENEDWLAPDHWQPDADLAVLALQTWVLRSGGRTVLVDTGVGNGRERPGAPHFHQRQGTFMEDLAAAGVRPEEVDVVVNTHLHADHVGWNTVDAGGEWVPAFPNARYLIPAADDAYFGPRGGYGGGAREIDRLVYEDSVAPVHRAGRADLWEGSHRIDGNLTLEAAPGHTPGSSVLRLASGSDRAVFVGDMLHSPVQVLRPSCNSCFCMDAALAADTRRRTLGRAAERGELVVPAHFGGTGAFEVRVENGRFGIGTWASGI
ncbi:MBL fold metallo-hydrolase [Streptomyces sp. NPDC089915]|uniref:MBL fold metallo-hydrolase n=1 Tax=Streptomyces sp. NPDC089915 TaxID=3155186 RepID=UPI00341CF9B0